MFGQRHVFEGGHVAPDAVLIPADFAGDEQALVQLLRPALDQSRDDFRHLYGATSYEELRRKGRVLARRGLVIVAATPR